MKYVNPYFLHTLLEPLTGLADDDDAVAEYADLDPNDGEQVREVIRKLIVPHARSLTPAVLERVQLAFRYYLTKPSSNFGRVYDSNLPPFDAPNDPRKFFVWVWEECFPEERYDLVDVGGYMENPDINEPLTT